ncbi:MAG: restriction endonuclease subunit S [Candidatus Marinimicrobia bacterium]|nr:restriction endonuclease subunit S [Candidatus Neomarinimicrobiota bacterium]
MEKYDNYKDSGIEWIGEIPEHWEVKKVKHLTKLQGGYAFKSDLFSSEGIPVIRIGDISENIKFEECKKIDDDTIPKEYWLEQFDTLIALSGATTGKTCFVNSIPPKAYINQRVARIMFSNKLLYYIVNSSFFQEQIFLTASGSAQENISNSQIENLEISISDIPEEQTAIAHYLDRKTAEIDELIADKKRLLELYEEEKTAIINQAVTKGINPNAPMKDSGIEWLGEIPGHWEVLPIKYTLSTPITDGPHETPELLPDGIPFISAEAIKNDKIDFSKKRGFISREEHERFSLKYKPQVGDVYMIKSGATTGNLAIVETDIEFNIWSPLAAMRPNYDMLLSEFLFYFMKSKSFFSAIEIGWNYGTQQNIGMKVIENIRMVLPSTSEQKEIVEYIKTHLIRLNSQIEKVNKLIDLLTEYRTALISEVVTGKIKVTE